MPSISVPTSSALAPSQRVPSTNPAVLRILNKLSRPSLLSLILDWLEDGNQALSAPFLRDDENDDDEQNLYPALETLEELREYYTEAQARKGGKREILDRVIEGDWRNGLSLYQLAMADMQYLYDHPLSQKWTALKVVKLKGEDSDEEAVEDKEVTTIPRFHPPTFLQNLQREVLPDVKAHYNLDRPKDLQMLLLRIYVLDSPYNTSLALSGSKKDSLDASKTLYIALPDASPHIYVSLATSTPGAASSDKHNPWDTRSLRKLILDGIPKAFSRPRARYALKSTNLMARSLEALNARRGQGRTGAAGGGWGVYSTQKNKTDTPLNNQLPTPPAEEESEDELAGDSESLVKAAGMKRKFQDEDMEALKRRKVVAQSRFGNSAKPSDGLGIERFDVRIEDPFPAIQSSSSTDNEVVVRSDDATEARKRKGRRSALETEIELESEKLREMERGAGTSDDEDETHDWIPDIRITFHGSHIFAGIRELVEHGIIDGAKMPGWMTGEEGVSVGVVKHGRISGFKGSGI